MFDTPINALIFDVDWAPDCVIKEISDYLIENQIKSTWFLTHKSPLFDKLSSRDDLFELGIHPNFLSNSTQGNDQKEIIDFCMKIVPNTKVMRTHAYYQSSLLYSYIAEYTSIETDASIFAPHVPNLQPFKYWVGGRYINRIPVYWEDDNEMKNPNSKWIDNNIDFNSNGLKIFAFHPIHLFLNSHNILDYVHLKENIRDLKDATCGQLYKFKNSQEKGVNDFFVKLIKHIRAQGTSYTLSEIISIYQGNI